MTVQLSVVVPVCNEAENVEPLAREIDAALRGRDYEMIFVDDGSDDDTAAILLRLKPELPRDRQPVRREPEVADLSTDHDVAVGDDQGARSARAPR